jgi:hypothetical protein
MALEYGLANFPLYFTDSTKQRISKAIAGLLYKQERNQSSFIDDLERIRKHFLCEFLRVQKLSLNSLFDVILQSGVFIDSCSDESTRILECPSCWIKRRKHAMPHLRRAKYKFRRSVLFCPISKKEYDEKNYPMALPNGRVYGIESLKTFMIEGRFIRIPQFDEVFDIQHKCKKVYII